MNDEETVITSDGTNQSISLRDILVLVVDDDYTSLIVVAGILRSWKYSVETVRNGGEALSALMSSRDKKFDLVVTDVHMPDMNGFELLRRISIEFQIPVVMMSADDKEQTMVKGLECGAVYFMRKPVRPDDLKNVWQYAIPKRKHEPSSSSQIVIEDSKVLGNEQDDHPEAANSSVRIVSPSNDDTPSVYSTSVPDKYYEEMVPAAKRKLTNSKQNNVKNSNGGQGYSNTPRAAVASAKKQKVAWSTELHNKFLDSLKIIGLDRAVPKKILEVMNVPGLTRENIASHLQKYRIFLKRVADVTETPDGTGLGMGNNRAYRSSSAASYSPLYYGFQLEHLEITDENLLRNMLKQELRAIRDPLYRGPSCRYQGPPTLSGTIKKTPFKSNYSSFALEPMDYLNKQMPPIIFGERLMGADHSNQLTSFGSGSSDDIIIQQVAPLPAPAPAPGGVLLFNDVLSEGNNINNMTDVYASSSNGFNMGSNTNVNCQTVKQSSELVHQFGMYMTGSRLHTGGLVNDSETQGGGGTIDIIGPSYHMETEMMMPQAAYCNAAMQHYENAPTTQPALQQPNVNDAPQLHDSMSDLTTTSNLDFSGFQGDFSGFLVNQLHGGGDETFNYLQFGEGLSSLIQTSSNGDTPYFEDDFFPWFDHEPFETQPGD